MVTKQSVELRLNKAFTKEARDAAIAARRAKSKAAYENAKSGGEGGSTPGERQRAQRNKFLSDNALKRRQQQEDLLAPEWPAHPKKSAPMTTSQAIRKYGFEDPRTIAIAKREEAAKKKAASPETKMIDKVKGEVKAELDKTHGKKISDQTAVTQAAYRAFNHARKNGDRNVSSLETAAKNANKTLRAMKDAYAKAVENHPKVKKLKADIAAYKKAKGW